MPPPPPPPHPHTLPPPSPRTLFALFGSQFWPPKNRRELGLVEANSSFQAIVEPKETHNFEANSSLQPEAGLRPELASTWWRGGGVGQGGCGTGSGGA